MARILLVDDEPDVIVVVSMILRRDGHDIITAFSGEEALEKLDDVKPDLITLDIMMSGIDGFETLKRIRENKKTSSIPVVILSVKSDESDIATCLELGANDYITKPYDRTVLLGKVRSILNSS
jgi:DNA-binding response OmpR family regulator